MAKKYDSLLPIYRKAGLLPEDTPFNRRAAEYAKRSAIIENMRKKRAEAKKKGKIHDK